jgi:hypothetical protein
MDTTRARRTSRTRRRRLVATAAAVGTVAAAGLAWLPTITAGASTGVERSHWITPTLTTTVFDAGTGQAWSGGESVGAKAYDTATLGGVSSAIQPTGTVTYSWFTNASCAGTPSSTQDVTLTGGTVPPSAATAALGAGSYSFQATYSGDDNEYNPSGPSPCEPFAVGKGSMTVSTVVDDAGTNAAWSGTEAAGAAAYDTATLAGAVSGFTPTGTVTYAYFTNGTCTGTPSSTQQVTLASAGVVPNSATTAALAAGSYAFDATYSGDGNYDASPTGACEAFTVAFVPTPVAPTTSPATAATTTAPETETTTPSTAGTATTGALAFTGGDIAGTGAIGLALLAVGAILVQLARRAQRQPEG